MQIIELNIAQEFDLLYPLIQLLNPEMGKQEFNDLLAEMRPRGYRCIVAVENGTYIGAAGFWVGSKFWCRKFMDVDNLVVDKAHRNQGIGEALLGWLEQEAVRLHCQLIDMPVYTHNHGAHKFYFRQGYVIEGYYFTKHLV